MPSHVTESAKNVLGFVAVKMKRTSSETQKKTPKGERLLGAGQGQGRARMPGLEPDPYAAKLGARMRDLRLEQGLSLADLHDAGGLTPSQMSSAERGRVGVTMRTIVSVGRALGLPPFLLMVFPDDDALAAVLEEIRQAYGGDLARMTETIERTLGEAPPKRRAHRARRKPHGQR